MKRPPVAATLVVLAAVAAMVALGVWQLRRAQWKEALLAQYAAVQGMPPVALPPVPDARHPPLFRRASAICLSVASWRSVAGRNATGQSGWSHIAQCRTGIEGPGLAVDIGWSRDAKPPAWRGGRVSGRLSPDRTQIYRLIADAPAPGLAASAPPSLDAIPNNHRAYAVQWFVFAALALVIYALALRRRKTGDSQTGPRDQSSGGPP